MNRGLYSGASALDALSRQQELIASNLANIQSSGFRRSILSFAERLNDREDPLLGTQPGAEGIDFTAGTIEQSGQPLDVAIGGEGFLKVQGPEGVLYTRSGIMQRNSDGQLVNGGMLVLGKDGPISIDKSVPLSEVQINSRGQVSYRGQNVGTLDVVSFNENRRLVPFGQIFFDRPADMSELPTDAQIVQGSRELSNVQPVIELVSLIVNSRMYESAQKVMRTISETIQQNYRS